MNGSSDDGPSFNMKIKSLYRLKRYQRKYYETDV